MSRLGRLTGRLVPGSRLYATVCRADIPGNNCIQVIILIRKQVVTDISDGTGEITGIVILAACYFLLLRELVIMIDDGRNTVIQKETAVAFLEDRYPGKSMGCRQTTGVLDEGETGFHLPSFVIEILEGFTGERFLREIGEEELRYIFCDADFHNAQLNRDVLCAGNKITGHTGCEIVIPMKSFLFRISGESQGNDSVIGVALMGKVLPEGGENSGGRIILEATKIRNTVMLSENRNIPCLITPVCNKDTLLTEIRIGETICNVLHELVVSRAFILAVDILNEDIKIEGMIHIKETINVEGIPGPGIGTGGTEVVRF